MKGEYHAHGGCEMWADLGGPWINRMRRLSGSVSNGGVCGLISASLEVEALCSDRGDLSVLCVPSEDVREVIGISRHVPGPRAEPSVRIHGLHPFV
jgi:hypothetical protein